MRSVVLRWTLRSAWRAPYPRDLGIYRGRVTHAAMLGRLRRLGRAATDSRALRAAVLDEIGRAVTFDAYVWPLTDPETSGATAPLAAVPPPLMPDLPRLIRLKYLTAGNRWTGLE